MSDSILQVNQIKDKGGNATGITVADSSANVTINNLTATTASIPAAAGSSLVLVKAYTGTNIVSAGVNFQDLFNSTYQDYIVKIQCVGMSNHNCNYSFSFINSSGTCRYWIFR